MPATERTTELKVRNGKTRGSAVSQALRALREEVETGPAKWSFTDRAGRSFRILVAVDAVSRGRAAELAHRVYRKSGYVPEERAKPVHEAVKADANVFTLLAEDEHGRAAGTVSLVFDSATGLPCDEIFHEELEGFRSRGRRLAEVTRLAIDEKCARSKALLVHMFDFIFRYALHVRHYTDFIIEVNPRHSDFYRRLLSFRDAGAVRPCPRVQNAPAELLHLDLNCAAAYVEEAHTENGPRPRNLFPYFYGPSKAWRVCRFLARSTGESIRNDPRSLRSREPGMESAVLPLGYPSNANGR